MIQLYMFASSFDKAQFLFVVVLIVVVLFIIIDITVNCSYYL